MMNRLTYENIKNSKANKLFENIGYNLTEYTIDESAQVIDFSYTMEQWQGDALEIYFQIENNVLEIYPHRWVKDNIKLYMMDIDILPLIYPITQLLKELDIDMESVYLENSEGIYKKIGDIDE